MPDIQLTCPACSTTVAAKAQRQMNGFWSLRTVPCNGCGVRLRYHSSLLPRLRRGAHIFRFGILILASWLALRALGTLPEGVLSVMAWIGLGATAVGILVTSTRPSSIRLEVGNDT